ncbi:kinesin-like protein KIF19, partial [Moschus berezovskii]|uniref:kinesin-like protein KIF19 n=1 Tax=Moschus berezovskii TaxID=68408 RepID=UPI002444E6EF
AEDPLCGHLVLTAQWAPQLALEQRCRELRALGRRLEETLPQRVSSKQEREALGLLCRVHELELRNAEMQPHALLRTSALRHCREVLRHLEQRRNLCEKIIRAQQQLIKDCNLAVPQHLKELYEAYLREQEEGSLERATMMDRLASQALQDSTWPKTSTPRTVPTSGESDLENVKMATSESPHQHRSFLPLLSTESEAKHLLKASSQAWQAKGSFVPTPPRIPASSLVTQEATTQVGPNGQINSSPENRENRSKIPLTGKGKKETLTDTKGISVKAARQRLPALGAEGRQLLAPTMRHSSLSLHSLGDTEDMRLPELLACKRPPSPTLQRSDSEDSLSSSTGEAPSQAVERHGDGPCPALQGQNKSLCRKREESLEAKRKRKSQSCEVTGQGTPTQIPAHPALQPALLSRPKMHVAGLRPVENHMSDQRMPVVGQRTPTIRPLGKATLPMSKVKLPPCQNLGPEDPSPLAAPSKPLDVSGRVIRMPRLPYGTNTEGKNGRF